MGSKVRNWKCIYLFRQLLVCSGVWTIFFMLGLIMGSPTVLIPQIRKAANSTEAVDDELASWLYSAMPFAALPWLFVLPPLMRAYGPRVPYIIACIDMLIAYTIFYFSTTCQHLLISEVVFGIALASCLTIGVAIVSEYSSPEYRGLFLTVKSASMLWGMWCANAIGTFFPWKYIAYVGFLCSFYTFSFVFWPESPQWLARNGRFNECRASFRWLNGVDENSEKNLEELLASHKNQETKFNNDWSMANVLRTVSRKPFYKPLLISALLAIQYHSGGKFLCAAYSLDILKRMTASERAAYIGMLILDGVTVFSMYFGCFLARILNRRTLYLTSSFIGITFLLIMSLYIYFVKLSLISENQVLTIALMTCYSIAMGCGPMILNSSIYVELLNGRFKYVQLIFAGLFFFLCFSVILKIAPFLFKNFGLHGTFLFLGILSGVCTGLLYIYLPETKDKTLQTIEEYFNDGEDVVPETEQLNCEENIIR